MKTLNCPNCNSIVYFENDSCINCNATLHFDPRIFNFIQLGNSSNNINDINAISKPCINHQFNLCNWIAADNADYCVSCKLNNEIPTVGDTENYQKYIKLENAKRQLVYQLLKLKLPVVSKIENNKLGLMFNFIPENNSKGLKTGYMDGTITILLKEADAVERAQIRKLLSEPYRTLIGHFRHEIGHYYFSQLINNQNLSQYRNLFGNEEIDYQQSLKRYYQNGPPNNWNAHYISKYASAHPAEDWAETWSHYLHIIDLLETAHCNNICFNENGITLNYIDPYNSTDTNTIIHQSIILNIVANNLNRSMGIPDTYPFVLPKPMYNKLAFIHSLFS
ncbi:zinc-binding metallopeptidase family protein [Aquimarina agarivorans]|uniref:zinc-binding metallopeptidase family protein n=1 Tax=Aquimarina agarivorans TaxID=980584 RepID=UPI000248F898|nr:putative zinc-binding metallopeptidase [Aquimarina agarivorans]